MIIGNPRKSIHFRTDVTGIHHYDVMMTYRSRFRSEKNLGYRVVWMNPMTYIRRCAEDIFGVEYDYLFRSREDEKIRKYVDLMKQGVQFDMPVLNYVKKSQEGLHRALAAIKLGDMYIPVMIVREINPEDEKGEFSK